MAKEIINEDFELPSENDVGFTAKGYVAGEDPADSEVEIEVVDDTPPEDKDRTPISANLAQEEELDNYSDRVKKRINQIQHKFHDERREKERLAREHAEAVRIAQAIYEENERLKQTMSWGQQEYLKEAQAGLEYAQRLAEDKYRRAYEAGNTEDLLEAQKELQNAAIKKMELSNFKMPAQPPVSQQENTLQRANNPVYSQQYTAPEQPAPAPRDPKADAWATRNPWYGVDEEMSSYAIGLHTKLVNSGVDPTSDDYYQTIDSRVREKFPENFDPIERPRKTSPVAPASRSTASKKMTLTASEVAIAKRLGVTPERYAQYKAKGDRVNG